MWAEFLEQYSKFRAPIPRFGSSDYRRSRTTHLFYDAITLGDPRQFQFEFCLWTLGIIRTMLQQQQGIELSKSGVSRLLRHLGLSPQVPKYKSYRQDPKALRRYLRRTFVEFIQKLRADAGRPIIVIADNAKYHKEGPVKRYLKPTPEGIQVAHLPTYSPELNSDEQVWNHLKRRLGKLFLESKEHLKDEVRKTMSSIQRSLSLILSFFELEDTRYAAEAQ